MNLIEFLKKGSGIHIKKANRGKFTQYCGGEVTSECIARGKKSSDPAVRKRATFAANARKWKHSKGGNITFAQEGTKVNTWQKIGNFLNSDLGQGLTSTLINGISNIGAAKSASNAAEAKNRSLSLNLENFKQKTWAEKYKEALTRQTDKSSIVNQHNAWQQANQESQLAIQQKQQEVQEQQAQNLQSANEAQSNAITDMISGLAGTAINALSKKGVPTSKVGTTGSSYQISQYWSNPSLGDKKYGSVNSDGSINVGGNTWNPMITPQLTPPSTNYSFLNK